MSTKVAAFWIDDQYDREQAGGGFSRYDAYVRRSPELNEYLDGASTDPQIRRSRFAEAAWATATSPVMCPSYIRHHARVLKGRIKTNTRNTTLIGVVRLVT